METKTDLAGGLSIGCGVAAGLDAFSARDFYSSYSPFVYTSFLLAGISLLLGFASLARRRTRESLVIPRVDVFRSLMTTLRLTPLALAGALVGFIITITVAWFASRTRPFPVMIVIALSSIPHILLYLSGPASEGIDILDRPAAQVPPAQRELRQAKEPLASTAPAPDELSGLNSLLTATRARLLAEIGALARRGNLNLVIGILTTLAAIGLLANVVLTSQGSFSDTPAVLKYYIPRLSFVVFVEVFSFFFLRLYKSSLDGIKYFQNELTNVELRFVALELALVGETSTTALASVAAELLRTERNFILKKGEATVEIRAAEINTESYKAAFTAAGNLLKSVKVKQ